MNFTKLTQYMDVLENEYKIPMADIKVMKGHEVVYRHRFGYADYERTVPLNDKHLFRLFSATKVITMTAAMQLIEQGKMKFHDRLSQYLPEFDHVTVAGSSDMAEFGKEKATDAISYIAHNDIRIIDLMTMTAGFSYNIDTKEIRDVYAATGGKGSTREVISALSKTPLLYEPGTRWCYSLAHDVMAAVIEVVSGMRFSEYLKKNIFDPQDATDLHFHWEKDPAIDRRVCDAYMADTEKGLFCQDDGSMSDIYVITENYESGGAGLCGSVDAYSMIADALACGGVGANGNRILKPETVELFTHAYTGHGAFRSDFDKLGRIGYQYGLGVRVMVDNSHAKSPIGEFGWDGAAGAFTLMDTKNELSFFYAQHILNHGDVYYVIHPKLRDLVYEAMGL